VPGYPNICFTNLVVIELPRNMYGHWTVNNPIASASVLELDGPALTDDIEVVPFTIVGFYFKRYVATLELVLATTHDFSVAVYR
jgi:hypothetical protein